MSVCIVHITTHEPGQHSQCSDKATGCTAEEFLISSWGEGICFQTVQTGCEVPSPSYSVGFRTTFPVGKAASA